MKLNDFLESTYVKTNIELQQEYSVFKQSRTLACQSLINGQRWVLKLVNYLILPVEFFLVTLGLIETPPTGKERIKTFNENLKAEKERKEPTLAAVEDLKQPS